MKKICFIGDLKSPFVKKDYEILKKYFKVYKLNKNSILDMLSLPLYILKSDIVFSWFASYHSFLSTIISKIFRKKSVIVAGGFDVSYVPEIDFGAYTKQISTIFSDFCFKHADVVISVSKSNRQELLNNAKTKPKRNILIYNGIPIDNFYPSGKKENIIITVCSSDSTRKGIHDFLRVAEFCYNCGFSYHFIVCGKIPQIDLQYLKKLAKPNVTFTGWLSEQQLLRHYQRAKIYLQLSKHEGFGITVAESMLCRCIPIVYNKYALPEVVGDSGIIVDTVQVAVCCIHAFIDNKNMGINARQRIIDNFSLQKRELELIRLLREL